MRQLDDAVRLARVVLGLMDPDSVDRLQVESILVSHCVVLLYSECEQRIRQAVRDRCGSNPDPLVASFAVSTADLVTGKLKLSELHNTLKRFSEQTKEEFEHACALDTDALDIAWDRMYKARKQVAHYGQPAGITFSQLEADIGMCRRVVDHYVAVVSKVSAAPGTQAAGSC